MSEPTQGPPDVDGYAVSHELGRGATSTVWAATDRDTGDRVAIKITDAAREQAADVLAQAARECAVLDRVPHEHLVRMRRAFARPDGSVALVMDLAEGGDLAELVTANGRLTEGEVATVLTPLADALAAVHHAGVVHGDLSPRNVLITAEGKPLLGDFAAARAVGEAEPPLVAGTPGFVAPERRAGAIPTEASDVYALGALAWFALTGRPLPESGAPDGEAVAGMVGAAYGPVVAELLAEDPDARPTPERAAAMLYAAAAPTPVRLVRASDADVAVAMTRRLRAQAVADSGPPASPGRRSWRRLRPLARAGGRASSAHRSAGPPRPPWWGGSPEGRHAAPGSSRRPSVHSRSSGPGRTRLTLIVVLVLVLAGGIGAWLRSARGAFTSQIDPAVARISGDTPGTVQRLAEVRARGLQQVQTDALLDAEVAGSPLHEHDLRLVAALHEAGRGYSALRFDVRSATLVELDPPAATVLARIDTLAGDAALPTEGVSAPGAPVLVELRLVDGNWRLADLREP